MVQGIPPSRQLAPPIPHASLAVRCRATAESGSLHALGAVQMPLRGAQGLRSGMKNRLARPVQVHWEARRLMRGRVLRLSLGVPRQTILPPRQS